MIEFHSPPPKEDIARKVTKSRGLVIGIEYTYGGAGNQWITINGVRYCTYWDIRAKNWRIGDLVSFDAVIRTHPNGQGRVHHAENITKLPVPVEGLATNNF